MAVVGVSIGLLVFFFGVKSTYTMAFLTSEFLLYFGKVV